MKKPLTVKRGRFVHIFDDPYTEKMFEGVARLVSPIENDGLTQVWRVKFANGDGSKVLSTVYRPVKVFGSLKAAYESEVQS